MRSGSLAAISSALLFAGVLFAPQAAQAQHQPLVKPGMCAQGYHPVCAVKQKTLVTYVNACAARGVRAHIVAADRACMDGCLRDMRRSAAPMQEASVASSAMPARRKNPARRISAREVAGAVLPGVRA